VFNALKAALNAQGSQTGRATGIGVLGGVSFEKNRRDAVALVANLAKAKPEAATTGLLAVNGDIQGTKRNLHLFFEG